MAGGSLADDGESLEADAIGRRGHGRTRAHAPAPIRRC